MTLTHNSISFYFQCGLNTASYLIVTNNEIRPITLETRKYKNYHIYTSQLLDFILGTPIPKFYLFITSQFGPYTPS